MKKLDFPSNSQGQLGLSIISVIFALGLASTLGVVVSKVSTSKNQSVHGLLLRSELIDLKIVLRNQIDCASFNSACSSPNGLTSLSKLGSSVAGSLIPLNGTQLGRWPVRAKCVASVVEIQVPAMTPAGIIKTPYEWKSLFKNFGARATMCGPDKDFADVDINDETPADPGNIACWTMPIAGPVTVAWKMANCGPGQECWAHLEDILLTQEWKMDSCGPGPWCWAQPIAGPLDITWKKDNCGAGRACWEAPTDVWLTREWKMINEECSFRRA